MRDTYNHAVTTRGNNDVVLALAVNNLHSGVIAHSLVDAEHNLVAINHVAELEIIIRLVFIKECLAFLLSQLLVASVVSSRSTSDFFSFFDSFISSVILDQLHVETS